MKRIVFVSIFIITLFWFAGQLQAEEVSATAIVTAEGISIFSLEFYTDENVLYSTSIPFTNIDPSRSMCYPDGRVEYDGKSDVGLVCKSNMGVVWYLKINATNFSPPPFSNANFKYYLGQPWNRTTSSQADGTLAQAPGWYDIPTSPTLVYASGSIDEINTPFGTLTMFSFAVIPTRLAGGVTYSCIITYTLTTTP